MYLLKFNIRLLGLYIHPLYFMSSFRVVPDTFYIKELKGFRVMDVENWGTEPGTRVCLWPMKTKNEGHKNQLFYYHRESNTIRSVFNDMCLDVSGKISFWPRRSNISINYLHISIEKCWNLCKFILGQHL